jgi:RNA polymerase sigma-70 factor (ECF subfamily)
MALGIGDLSMKRGKSTSKRTKEMSAGESADPATGVGLQDVLQQLLTHESDFRAFVRRRLADDAMAEDVLQQSLMRAVERQHTLQQSENLVGWFYRILRNAIVDVYRSRAAESKKTDTFLQELITAGEDKTPALNELRPTVCACLQLLLPNILPPMPTCSSSSTCKASPLLLWHKSSISRRTTSPYASIAHARHYAPAWRNLVASAPNTGASTASASSRVPDPAENQSSRAL